MLGLPMETVGLYIPHSDKLRTWNSKTKYCLFTIYTGKPVGLLFGSVWANGKQISVLEKFRSGLALTICRNPTICQKICTTATADEKVAKQKL